MRRAKVIIDSKFQDTSLCELWQSQGPKTTKSFPLAESRLNFIELKLFAVTIGPNRDVRCSSLKNTIYIRQEKKILKTLPKTFFFPMIRIF
jgi:hypothetical protein